MRLEQEGGIDKARQSISDGIIHPRNVGNGNMEIVLCCNKNKALTKCIRNGASDMPSLWHTVLPLDAVLLEGLGPSCLNPMAVPKGPVSDFGRGVGVEVHVWGVWPIRFKEEGCPIPGGGKS